MAVVTGEVMAVATERGMGQEAHHPLVFRFSIRAACAASAALTAEAVGRAVAQTVASLPHQDSGRHPPALRPLGAVPPDSFAAAEIVLYPQLPMAQQKHSGNNI